MTTRTKTTTSKGIEDAAVQAKETVENFVKVGQEAAAKNYEQALAMTKEHVEKASQQFYKNIDDLASFNKDNVEAVVKSSSIFAKGYEDLSKSLMAYAQSAMDLGMATGKAMMTVKTVRELVDLQSEYAKASFDGLLAETAKLSEMSVKVTSDALEPINARVNVAMEKFAKPVAA